MGNNGLSNGDVERIAGATAEEVSRCLEVAPGDFAADRYREPRWDVIHALEGELRDERDATQRYMDLAGKMAHLKRPDLAEALRNISGDEQRHALTLERAINELKKQWA
ncbi:MAG: ferritin family protein [Chloroflexota bacterium]